MGEYIGRESLPNMLASNDNRLTTVERLARTGPSGCTSTTRPSDPYVGQTIWETDLSRLCMFDGIGWLDMHEQIYVNDVSAAQGAMQAPSYVNNWADYGSGFRNGGYWKDTDGMVHLTGLIKKTSGSNPSVAFTLPTGYRPYDNVAVSIADASGAFHACDISSAGVVTIGTGASTSWVSLTGISFKAATTVAEHLRGAEAVTFPTAGNTTYLLPLFQQYVNSGVHYAAGRFHLDKFGCAHGAGAIQEVNFGTPTGDRSAMFHVPPRMATNLMRFSNHNASWGGGANIWTVTETIGATAFFRYGTGTNGWMSLENCSWPTYRMQNWTLAGALSNSWVDTGYKTSPNVGYWKDNRGMVWVQGYIQSGTLTATAFTLPSGYRPSGHLIFHTNANGVWGRVDVYSDGTVKPQNTGPIALDFYFRAE